MSVNNHQRQLQEFEEFAENKFIDHSVEAFQQRVPMHDSQQTYPSSQQILEMELHDKIDEMLTTDNAHLGPSLNRIKDDYVSKIRAVESANARFL
jgi:hypothetical protein